MKKSHISLILLSILFTSHLFSLNSKLLFEKNKNQWPHQVKYKAGLGNGTTLYMENNKFTYVKYDPKELEQIHHNRELARKSKKNSNEIVHLHAFQMTFLNANPNPEIKEEGKSDFYHNYFIGNNPSTWSSEVYSYNKITYSNLYSGIDLVAYDHEQTFKYDFIVSEGSNPSNIVMHFEGAEKISVVNNKLIIKTSVGEIIENTPFSYQIINGVKKEVECLYQLSVDEKTLSFSFPNSYNKNYELVIDPVVLVGATYSGASIQATTFGHCATYDQNGNIYTGGECFDTGYPVSIGAFQTIFAGGVDIAISKLNPNATNLLWATYIGGDMGDVPNSLFVHTNGEIYVLGATESTNFPCSLGAYDNSYNGQVDIIVTHLNTSGTALIGSTYIGSNGYDGGFYAPWGINGHDGMRGEIIVDATGNAWVASFTDSPNFPTTTGAYDQTLNGAGTFDACIFKLSSNLSTLNWSSFYGGSGNDASYGLRLNNLGELYITGCSASNNLPVTTNAYNQTYNGGQLDAYVARFNASGSSLLASTYFGTSNDEISYFIDLDISGDPYLYGISTGGSMPVTPGVYNNPNSQNFVSKFNSTLTTLQFSTVFGEAFGGYLEPEAFMVDLCGNIYMSGFNSTLAYPLTSDAFFSTQTDGTCYFMVLSKNALTQKFGSFYYGSHVDGGTSRFDPSGSIYQGICSGGECVSTAGAWSSQATAPGWDMFVVKIDFQMSGVEALASAAPSNTTCANHTINFVNNSNGINYVWNFGDASPTSTITTPTHTYTNTGTYTVTLIANDSTSCNLSDTSHVIITVINPTNLRIDTVVCANLPIVFNIPSNNTYTWSPNTYISNTSAVSTTVIPQNSITYSIQANIAPNCISSNTINIITKKDVVLTSDFTYELSPCSNDVVFRALNSSDNYYWNFGDNIQQTNISNPTHIYETTKDYTVQLIQTKQSICANYPLVSDTSIHILQLDASLYSITKVPNTFTPNGDGANDIFKVASDYCTDIEFIIYNRWGQEVLKTNLNYWNGRKNNVGKEMDEGTYFYIINYKNQVFSKKSDSGFLTLFR